MTFDIQQLLAEQHARSQKEDLVLRSFDDLDADQKGPVLAKLVQRMGMSHTKPVKPKAIPAKASGPALHSTFLEKTLAFLSEHPEGVTARQVSDATGQATAPADSTLRYALRRGLACHEGRLWYPTPEAAKEGAVRDIKRVIQQLILDALVDASRAMTRKEVIAAVEADAAIADLTSDDIENELEALVSRRWLAFSTNVGPNKASVYQLVPGAPTKA